MFEQYFLHNILHVSFIFFDIFDIFSLLLKKHDIRPLNNLKLLLHHYIYIYTVIKKTN